MQMVYWRRRYILDCNNGFKPARNWSVDCFLFVFEQLIYQMCEALTNFNAEKEKKDILPESEVKSTMFS